MRPEIVAKTAEKTDIRYSRIANIDFGAEASRAADSVQSRCPSAAAVDLCISCRRAVSEPGGGTRQRAPSGYSGPRGFSGPASLDARRAGAAGVLCARRSLRLPGGSRCDQARSAHRPWGGAAESGHRQQRGSSAGLGAPPRYGERPGAFTDLQDGSAGGDSRSSVARDAGFARCIARRARAGADARREIARGKAQSGRCGLTIPISHT